MPRDVLPSAVVEVLAFHGSAEVVAGPESRPARREVPVAPFEDVIYLLLPRGGPLDDALLDSHRVALHARDRTGASYRLSLEGRAPAPVSLGRHPMRASLSAWLPEGHRIETYTVSPFVAEDVDFRRTEADGEEHRYQGASRADNPPTWRRWATAAWGGWALPLAGLSVVAPWLMLTWMGTETPMRPLGWLVAALGGLLAIGSLRLMLLSLSFERWREGTARAQDAGLLVDGMLAPRPLLRVGRLGLGVAAIFIALSASTWGRGLGLVALLANGAWLAGPAWILHLSMRSPESPR